ncbi:phage protein Gp36 family protein [Niabella sp. 22666]|uniref:phage protein Gp36 family protein n=1 Tax=Niabella sp. 22666 TaxID=3453954 RepID=UPI003F838383
MPFLSKEDFPASVHDDILNALTRSEDDVVTENVSRAIDEVAAYLNGRYDTTAIFAKTGNARNKFILRITNIMALYYTYLAHNPRKITQVMKDEFDRAIETLEGIQKGDINPVGLDTPPVEDPNATSGNGAPIQWGSSEPLGTDW